MKETPPKMTCPQCEGTGEISISKGLQETLSFFKKGASYTASEIWDIQTGGMSVTGINNRLERLRDLDLLVRVRDGRNFRYSLPS